MSPGSLIRSSDLKVSLLIIFSSSAVMNSNMLLFAPLCFLLCWMLPVDSMVVRLSFTNQPVPLSLAKDAVDDMYSCCQSKMAEKVKEIFKSENTGTFADVWNKAEKCAKTKLSQRDPEDQALTENHMQAICVYTSDYEKFYVKFNDHVRHSRSNYGTKFPFHFLHFWLTSAVQIINKNSANCERCYRRTNQKFTGETGQIIRFGSFTSSSYNPRLFNFGQKTCFKITTCSGAFLKHYSDYGDSEQEVLIPPYEMFKITAKKKGRDVAQLSDCGVVYVLESAGVLSSLNCKAVK